MKKKVILIVDNQPEYLATRAEYVRAAGFSVLTATNPEVARRLAQRKHIDLSVIDLRLLNDDNPQDYTGLFLAEELHPRMKIILNTGFPELRTALAALRRDPSGETVADNYISKDDGPAALISEIRRLCAAPGEARQTIGGRSWKSIRLVLAFLTIIAVIIIVIMGISWDNMYVVMVLLLAGLQVIWAIIPVIWSKN